MEPVVRRLTQPLYDTVQMAAAAGPRTFNFFSTPLNQFLVGTTPKTLAHTNLVQAGKLEEGSKFQIQGLSWYPNAEIAAGTRPVFVDYHELQTGFVELKFGTRTLLQLKTSQIPAGGAELSYFSNIAAAATEYNVNRGINAVSNRFVLDNPIMIENNESFRVEFTVPGTTTVIMDVTFQLWGDLYQPV